MSNVSVTWLGQAGFMVDAGNGKVLFDPYLSDSCNRLHNFKRMMPRIYSTASLKPSIVVVTHDHDDHFDADCIGELLSYGGFFIGAPDAAKHAVAIGVSEDSITALEIGKTVSCNGLKITAVPADHGELAPEAVGLLVEIAGVRFYFAGDTSYCEQAFATARDFSPHIAILPINGAFGNLNEMEAAHAAAYIKPKAVWPCHYWMFREHGGDPQKFAEAMEDLAPQIPIIFKAPGEEHII